MNPGLSFFMSAFLGALILALTTYLFPGSIVALWIGFILCFLNGYLWGEMTQW